MQSFVDSLGKTVAIIGAQWGDEGKGKVTDILGQHVDIIARACGGANAGHTIIVNGAKHVFHLLPAACLHAEKPVILGSGMVIHLPTLLEEITTLKETGIDILPRLKISRAAHIVFEFHKAIDTALEERRMKGGIGTTRRGIGPAYTDKASRHGIRMEKLLQGNLREELERRAGDIEAQYGVTVSIEREMQALKQATEALKGTIVDSLPELMRSFVESGKSMLIEGAQATLLDIDHGTYPYVTSSSTTAAGALQGLGLPPKVLDACVGVAKAYCTRVGSGDFPAEDTGERGKKLRERGGEYGATTGRPRRCGWLSIPDLRYSAFINGFTCLNITKLDVLDDEENIPVLVGQKKDGTPVMETLPGWKTSTVGITSYEKLPKEARLYLEFIEKKSGVKVGLIGTGPKREDMIARPV